ncbi:MAG: hypothetical protein WKG06_13960 [Segetibacter sp.]
MKRVNAVIAICLPNFSTSIASFGGSMRWRKAAVSGVVLVGDFPSSGVASLRDQQVGAILEQHEMDYFGVDAVLADPHGYWEWMGLAPIFPPGSTQGSRLPWDESRHPNGSLYVRNQWSTPAFITHDKAQWQVHHAERNSQKIAADPKFWVGRITASQSAWRTGQSGFEYSETEELRLLIDYFNRNHQHRTVPRQRRSYLSRSRFRWQLAKRANQNDKYNCRSKHCCKCR